MDKLEYKLKTKAQDNEELHYLLAETRQLLNNPLVELVIGSLFIAYMTRGTQSTFEKFTGIDWNRMGLSAGLIAAIQAQQLSAVVPYVAQNLPAIAGLIK